MQALRTIILLCLLATGAGSALTQNPKSAPPTGALARGPLYQAAPGVLAQASSADLALSPITAPGPPYAPGQTLTLHLVLTNNGPSSAEAITVSAQPRNLTIQSVQGIARCNAFPCTIGGLRWKQSLPLDVTAAIGSAGPFFFGVHVTFRGRDTNSSNDQVSFSGATQQTKSSSAPVPGTTTVATYPTNASKIPGTPPPLPPAVTNQPTDTQTSTESAPPKAPTVSATDPSPNADPNPDIPPSVSISRPPPPAYAPVLVATVAPAGPYRAGQTVTIVVTLNGTNPRYNQPPQIEGAANNLRFLGADIGCIQQPCAMVPSSKTSYKASLVATVVAAGRFSYTAAVRGAQGPATAAGVARAASRAWIGVLAVILGIAAILTSVLRHRWWRSRITVSSSARLHSAHSSCTPLSFAIPPIHLRILFPPGVASSGPLTRRRKDVTHV